MRTYEPVRMHAGNNSQTEPRYHAVPPAAVSDFGTALCGARPGRTGKGWRPEKGEAVTCPGCLRRMEERR